MSDQVSHLPTGVEGILTWSNTPQAERHLDKSSSAEATYTPSLNGCQKSWETVAESSACDGLTGASYQTCATHRQCSLWREQHQNKGSKHKYGATTPQVCHLLHSTRHPPACQTAGSGCAAGVPGEDVTKHSNMLPDPLQTQPLPDALVCTVGQTHTVIIARKSPFPRTNKHKHTNKTPDTHLLLLLPTGRL